MLREPVLRRCLCLQEVILHLNLNLWNGKNWNAKVQRASVSDSSLIEKEDVSETLQGRFCVLQAECRSSNV